MAERKIETGPECPFSDWCTDNKKCMSANVVGVALHKYLENPTSITKAHLSDVVVENEVCQSGEAKTARKTAKSILANGH